MAYDQDSMLEPFQRGGAYGNDMMTMTGPIGKRRRRHGLQPGQRLADGSTYSGNLLFDSLVQTKEGLEQKIALLQGQLDEVKQQIKAAKDVDVPEVESSIDASQTAIALANDNLISLEDVVEELGLDPSQKVTKTHVEEYLRLLDVNDSGSQELPEPSSP